VFKKFKIRFPAASLDFTWTAREQKGCCSNRHVCRMLLKLPQGAGRGWCGSAAVHGLRHSMVLQQGMSTGALEEGRAPRVLSKPPPHQGNGGNNRRTHHLQWRQWWRGRSCNGTARRGSSQLFRRSIRFEPNLLDVRNEVSRQKARSAVELHPPCWSQRWFAVAPQRCQY
jgi:hypothetical protein